MVLKFDVLKDLSQVERSVQECQAEGLDLFSDRPKNWDSLLAYQSIKAECQKGAHVFDAGGEYYSVIGPWLAKHHQADVTVANLAFTDPKQVDSVLYEHGNIEHLAYRDESFDAMTCLSVLEHGVNLKHFFSEAYRLLKPGGLLIVSVDYEKEKIDCSGIMAFGVPMVIFSANETDEMLNIASDEGFIVPTIDAYEPTEGPVKWKGKEYGFFYVELKKPLEGQCQKSISHKQASAKRGVEIIDIPYLEMMITHKCSYHCDGCSVYSNYTPKDSVAFKDGKQWLTDWSKRINPQSFRIIGGEPTLHDELFSYIELAHELWPDSNRVLVSNGSHLDRQPDLPKILAKTKTKLHLSFHSDEPAYLEKMKEVLALIYQWWTETGVECFTGDHRLFSRSHIGIGENMLPFNDGKPAQSWKNCNSRECKNLMHNRIWKCPQILYLEDTLKKFDIADSPEWAPYIGYQGIGLEASDDQLRKFFARQAEPICGMCPADPVLYNKDIRNIKFKNNHLAYIPVNFKKVDFPAFVNEHCRKK